MSNLTNTSTPQFLVVGTAKAGTTSLYRYLLQHPDIAIPVKETFFFLKELYAQNHLPYPQQRPKRDLILSEEHWENCYRGLEGKIVGEIGTGYLYHHELAIPQIKEYLGTDVKICIVLRDPVERTFSSYKHFTKDLHENHDFETALSQEEARKSEHWDFMWHHTAMSKYSEQVEAYLNAFPHVKVFYYEDLRDHPEDFMQSFFTFIGLTAPEGADFSTRFNPSGQVRSKWLQQTITQESAFKRLFRPMFRALVGKERRAKIRKYVKERNLKSANELTEQQRAQLEHLFQEDTTRLAQLLEAPLPWSIEKNVAANA